MSIIYSYPEQAPLNLNDMLIGTSSVKVGGKQKNITRNFSLKQIADFIGEGGGVFNPTASDFQIGVFNQGGTKLTGSIMSQDTFPNGTGITVAGNLTTTNNLTALGDVVLGNQQLTNNIKLLSETYLSGQIRDISGNLGNTDQILISNNIGFVSWTDYKAGLVYQGVWNATTGRTTPDNILLQSGIGQNGQFYIVTVAGNYQLDGNPASPESPPYWQIGDWVIFVSKGSTNEWQKIDNTSVLTGTGTDNKIAMWTGGATPSVTLADSMISQDAGATAVTITGTVIPTTITDKDTAVGTAGQILSSTEIAGVAGIGWIDNQVGTVTGTGVTNTLPIWSNGPSGTLGNSILNQVAAAGVFTDTHLSIQGSGGLSTQNLQLNKSLWDGGDGATIARSAGTDGQVLTSSTQGLAPDQYQEVKWVDPTTIGDTYTLQSASTPGANRVPIDLTAASGAAASSILNLVEGTGITLAQTSETEITISGSAQGVTGSGTVNKLPKFDTTTSLTDSIVSETATTSAITIVYPRPVAPPTFAGFAVREAYWNGSTAVYGDLSASTIDLSSNPFGNGSGLIGSFSVGSDSGNAAFRTQYPLLPTQSNGNNTTTFGSNVQTFVFKWSNGATITFTQTGVININLASGIQGFQLDLGQASFGSPAGTFWGTQMQYVSGSGTITAGDNLIVVEATSASLDVTTHKIINVVDPTDAQDAATKAYVDASSSDTTYTLAAGAKTSSSVPLNLSPSTGSDTTVNLTEGTGITLTQTSATEITIEGTAQGVTGSGTVNQLPKFGTTTSLVDSIVKEIPSGTSTNYTADNAFFQPIGVACGSSGFNIPPIGASTTNRKIRWVRPSTDSFPTWPTPANFPYTETGTVGTVTFQNNNIVRCTNNALCLVARPSNTYNLVGYEVDWDNSNSYIVILEFSAADWATNSAITSEGVYNDTSTYGAGTITSLVLASTATGAEIEIAGELDMTSNKVLNVLDPVNPQDAATKAYVDTTAAGSGALVYQTGYNAITNFPDLTTGGTGVLQGFTYAVTAGPSTTFWSPPLEVGDLLIANVDNPTTIADWTEIQSNIGAAGSGTTDGATVKGVAGFNSNDFDVSVNGWVEAKDFTGNTPGYVPDATSATAGTFLKEDGTWSAITPTAGVGSYTTGNGTILSPQTTSVQLAIDPGTVSGSVYTFLNGLSLGDLVQITDGTVNGFFTYSIAGGYPNAYRFAYVSGEIPTNFSTNANVINLRNASAGVIGDISGSGNGSSVTYFTGVVGDTGVKEITSNADIVIDSNGYLGLGTSNPLYSLDIDSIYATPTIQVQDSQQGNFLRLSSDGGSFSSKIESSNDIQFIDGNGNMLMNMTTMAGYVGIGTTAAQFPNSKLHINDQYATSLLTLESDSETQRTDYRYTSGGINPYASFGTDMGDFTMDLLYQGNQTRLFNFNKDGRLGIGPYVVPNYALDVQEGSMTGNDTVINVQSQMSYNQLQIGAGVNFGSTNYIDSNVAFQIKRSSTDVMHIDFDTMYYAPRVGINTTQPVVSFEIATQDAIKIPVGSNSDRSGIMASDGMLRYNTDALEFEGYSNNAWGAIGGGGAPVIIKESFSPFVGQTNYDLNPLGQNNPQDENYVNVYIDGVYQNLNTIAGVNTTGSGASAMTTVTMVSGAPAGVTVEIVSTI